MVLQTKSPKGIIGWYLLFFAAIMALSPNDAGLAGTLLIACGLSTRVLIRNLHRTEKQPESHSYFSV